MEKSLVLDTWTCLPKQVDKVDFDCIVDGTLTGVTKK